MIRQYLQSVLPHLAADRVGPRHDGGLQLFEGRRGRGKSYALMGYVRMAIKGRHPLRLNFDVDRYRLAVQAFMRREFPSMGAAMEWVHANVRTVSTWDELIMGGNAVILLDESSRIFDSRARGAIPQVALEWLQQSRKLHLTIVLAAQSFDWLDVRVRQLADTLWLTKRAGTRSINVPPTAVYAYGVDPWASGLSETAARRDAHSLMVVPFDLSLAQCYNSWEVIRVISGEPSYRSVLEYVESPAWRAATGAHSGLPRVRLAAGSYS